MSLEVCDHSNQAPQDLVQHLHQSQAGTGRHKCPVCAFHEGRYRSTKYVGGAHERCQGGNRAPTVMLAGLPDSQGGSGRHRCCICAYSAGLAYSLALEEATEDIATGDRVEEPPSGGPGGSEGDKTLRLISQYERDPANRAEALRIHKNTCFACGFNFDTTYGADVARGYIEIHHLTMVSQLKGRRVDPKTEMAPLCSNCHSIAHRSSKKLLSIEEIRAAIARQRNRVKGP